ncbi:MAG: hypothetical protein QOI72_1473, partial [Solirubrobacterales bacterium]|nr:hypothetical protein [Solirubrobacterales bacterium]
MGTEPTESRDHPDQMKQGLGGGLLKGLGVTMKTMLTPAVTQQYPHVK